MCLLYVSLGSRVSPSMFGLMFMGRVMLSICSSSCVLYSAVSGVKRVHVVLSGLRMRLFVFVHVCISCSYNWMFAFAIFMSLCVDVMVMSCCCLSTPMTLASGGSPMFPLVVPQPASPSIWPAVQSLRRGLSTNPGGDNVVRMWVQLKR